jgi:hypothetical protein
VEPQSMLEFYAALHVALQHLQQLVTITYMKKKRKR